VLKDEDDVEENTKNTEKEFGDVKGTRKGRIGIIEEIDDDLEETEETSSHVHDNIENGPTNRTFPQIIPVDLR